jgi:putative MATE family efflux protein
MQTMQENRMGVRAITPLVLSMSFPIMLSMLVQALYNVVDSLFVAHYSHKALTAVSLAFPLQSLVIALSVGTSIGVNSLLSRKLGAKDWEGANKTAGNGIILSILGWAFFAILAILFSKRFITFFSDDPELIRMGGQYLFVCLFFSLGIFIEINNERVLQSTGDTIRPMIIQFSGAITNIILDPILIFGLLGFPRLGVLGAAIATVTGQHVAALLSIYYVRRNKEVTITKKDLKLDKRIVRDIYFVGVPAIVMQGIGTILTTSLNKILIAFGTDAVAIYGIYFRLQSFIFMPIFGLNSGMIPIIGYNYGAQRPKRITKTIRVGITVALIIMAFGTALFTFFPHVLLALFNASATMLEIGTIALQRLSMCFLMAGVSISLSALFQGMGNGYYSMIISFTRQLVFLLPAAYLLGRFFGLNALWYSFFIAEFSAFFLSLLFFRTIYKNRIKPMYQ